MTWFDDKELSYLICTIYRCCIFWQNKDIKMLKVVFVHICSIVIARPPTKLTVLIWECDESLARNVMIEAPAAIQSYPTLITLYHAKETNILHGGIFICVMPEHFMFEKLNIEKNLGLHFKEKFYVLEYKNSEWGPTGIQCVSACWNTI